MRKLLTILLLGLFLISCGDDDTTTSDDDDYNDAGAAGDDDDNDDNVEYRSECERIWVEACDIDCEYCGEDSDHCADCRYPSDKLEVTFTEDGCTKEFVDKHQAWIDSWEPYDKSACYDKD